MKHLSVALAVLFLSMSLGGAHAQNCIDPPVTQAGKCAKQAGATCDPGSRQWINGKKAAFQACKAAVGATPTNNDKNRSR